MKASPSNAHSPNLNGTFCSCDPFAGGRDDKWTAFPATLHEMKLFGLVLTVRLEGPASQYKITTHLHGTQLAT